MIVLHDRHFTPQSGSVSKARTELTVGSCGCNMCNIELTRGHKMAVHDEVLATAQRLCAAQRTRQFTPADVVRALPHLNENTVRTHIVSRCCVNAPENHDHRLPYFRRLRRGVYEICDSYSLPVRQGAAARADVDGALQETIHTVISESEGAYVAECLEVGVVTQGESLDETLRNLREAVELFMEDEEPTALGLVSNPRLAISFETTAR